MENIEQFKRHIAFDLDGTLLEEEEWPNFGKSIDKNIEFLRKLHDAGVPIAIYTARIYQDDKMREKTIEELKNRDIPWDELGCEKKPYYVLFVDDRVEKVEWNEPWSDGNKKAILDIIKKYKMNEKEIEAAYKERTEDEWYEFWKEIGLKEKEGSVMQGVKPYIEYVSTKWMSQFHEFDRAGEHANKTKESLAGMKRAIQELGITSPIYMNVNPVNKTCKIGEGNHRVMFAEELGIDKVPVWVLIDRSGKSDFTHKCDGIRSVKELMQYGAGEPYNVGEPYLPYDMKPSHVFKDIPIEGMAMPRDVDLAKTYYHGTDKIDNVNKILTEGIKPREITNKSQMAPVKNKVYITPDIAYAQIYAIGCDCAGDSPEGWVKEDGSDRYGYLFVIDGAQLKDIQPDEDSIGEMLYEQMNKQRDDLQWLYDLGKRELTINQWEHVWDGDVAYWAQSGKKLVKYLSDDKKLELIDKGAHIAHEGIIWPKETWKIDRMRIDELKKDGSNFFKIAERIETKVAAGKIKLSTYISKDKFEYVYFATGGQLMSLSNGQLTQAIIDEIVDKKPGAIWLIRNKMKKFQDFMDEWEQKGMEPKITNYSHPSDNMQHIIVYLKDGILGEYFIIRVYGKEQYIVSLKGLIKVDPARYILAYEADVKWYITPDGKVYKLKSNQHHFDWFVENYNVALKYFPEWEFLKKIKEAKKNKEDVDTQEFIDEFGETFPSKEFDSQGWIRVNLEDGDIVVEYYDDKNLNLVNDLIMKYEPNKIYLQRTKGMQRYKTKEITFEEFENNDFKINATLDEELDDKFKDMSEEDIIRLLDKIKKKNLNINVLKLAWPEINTQKSDLLKKLKEGEKNVV